MGLKHGMANRIATVTKAIAIASQFPLLPVLVPVLGLDLSRVPGRQFDDDFTGAGQGRGGAPGFGDRRVSKDYNGHGVYRDIRKYCVCYP